MKLKLIYLLYFIFNDIFQCRNLYNLLGVNWPLSLCTQLRLCLYAGLCPLWSSVVTTDGVTYFLQVRLLSHLISPWLSMLKPLPCANQHMAILRREQMIQDRYVHKNVREALDTQKRSCMRPVVFSKLGGSTLPWPGGGVLSWQGRCSSPPQAESPQLVWPCRIQLV